MLYSNGLFFLVVTLYLQGLVTLDPLECKITEKGREYEGYTNTTTSGLACQAWAVTTPHLHKFYQSDVASDSNYCRNPDNDKEPWCYTADPKVRFEYCGIPFCHCEIPGDLNEHLQYQMKEYRINRYISLSCAPGYYLVGSYYVLCQSDLTWRSEFPTCKGVQCQISPYIDALLEYDKRDYFYPEQVTFSCPYGYNVVGSSVLSCTTTRVWDESYPKCQGVKCEIRVTRDRLLYVVKEYKYPDEIRFSCPIGYTLSGSSVLACTGSGNWNDTFPLCDAVRCPSPKPETHLIFTQKPYVYLDAIQLTCERGYNLTGSDTSVCKQDGKWYPILPTCIGVPCPDLSRFLSSPHLIFQNRQYRHAETVGFTCEEGYKIVGPTVISCLHTGQWSALVPNCELITCPSINTTKFLVLEKGDLKTTYTYKQQANFSCSGGAIMQGSTSLVCGMDGKWSDNVPVCIKAAAAEQTGGMSGGSVAGVVILVLAIIAATIVLVLLFIRRRRKRKEFGKRKVTYSVRLDASLKRRNTELFTSFLPGVEEKNTTGSPYQNVDFPKQSPDYYDFKPITTFSDGAVPVENFAVCVHAKIQAGTYFQTEFQKLKSGLLDDCTNAHLPVNKIKNKYKKIYPYDRTRVILTIEDPSESDYINASYINGFGTVNSYVAAQGPIETTVVDFWRMVWQLKSGKIVMLTNPEEDGKVKCKQYWPVSRETIFGKIYVKMDSEENYGLYTIRKISIRKGTDIRLVKQFHFTAWPDKGVPAHPDCIVQFRKKVVNAEDVSNGPVIVHCSAGIGRTGTYIALDYLIAEAQNTGSVNVYSCVEILRRQRLNMVQTVEQYQFLHEALLEHIQGSTAIKFREFAETYRELKKQDSVSGKTELQKQYQVLCERTLVLPDNAIVVGKKDENKHKSRYNNVLPVDKYRPLLSSAETDYINAVFLPCNKKKMAYIITQMPMPNTIEDFLYLIYEQQVNAIVMLNTEENDAMQSIGYYCPDNKEGEIFGPFHIKIDNSALLDSVEIISLRLRYKQQETRGIKVFKCLSWPEFHPTPYSVTEFLHLHDLVHDWHKPTENDPLIVHCMNGADKSGLFCAIDTILDAIQHNEVIDVQRTIKEMRLRRPQIIPNLEQYEFCYEVISQYLKQFDVYANV